MAKMYLPKAPIISNEVKKRLYNDHEKKLGGGFAGEVFLTRYKGMPAVFKEFVGRNGITVLEAELDALAALATAEGVPKLLGIFYGHPPFILMSYCGEKTFDEVLEGPKLPDRVYISLLLSVAEALSQVHAHEYVHNDLKLENIVIGKDPPDEDTRAFIVDFGLALLTNQILTVPAVMNGSHENCPWMPPENFLLRPCQPKGDVWSLGYIIRQVLQTAKWSHCPEDLHCVVSRCLQKCSKDRAELKEVREALRKVLEKHVKRLL